MVGPSPGGTEQANSAELYLYHLPADPPHSAGGLPATCVEEGSSCYSAVEGSTAGGAYSGDGRDARESSERKQRRRMLVWGESNSCPECAEAGFGLMVSFNAALISFNCTKPTDVLVYPQYYTSQVSCGDCGARFHSMCARKVKQRVALANSASTNTRMRPQGFLCVDCAD